MLREAAKADRVVDLFCGSGAVARFVAQKTAIPVLAIDLQVGGRHYADGHRTVRRPAQQNIEWRNRGVGDSK